MPANDRRQELRREEDEVLVYRVKQLEDQVRVFAPTATQVAIHEHQLDEGNTRMKALEDGLERVTLCVNAIEIKLEGISVKLALILTGAGLAGGAIVAVVTRALGH